MRQRQYEILVVVQVRPIEPRARLAIATARGRAADPVKLDAWCGRFRRTLERALGEAEENVLEQMAEDARQMPLFEPGFSLEAT